MCPVAFWRVCSTRAEAIFPLLALALNARTGDPAKMASKALNLAHISKIAISYNPFDPVAKLCREFTKRVLLRQQAFFGAAVTSNCPFYGQFRPRSERACTRAACLCRARARGTCSLSHTRVRRPPPRIAAHGRTRAGQL